MHYKCYDSNCPEGFEELGAIPLGWNVETEMIPTTDNKASSLLYRCHCPKHQDWVRCVYCNHKILRYEIHSCPVSSTNELPTPAASGRNF